MSNEDFHEPPEQPAREPDARENEARVALEGFVEGHKESVFFSRQLEVHNEDEWYHWITNRALRELAGRGLLRTEVRELKTGGSIHLMWHKNHRYYRRDAKKVVQLVEEYSDPNIGGALGLQGEALVLEGFARSQFVMRSRDTRSHGGRTWTQTDHDLDFVFERDDRVYGVEVKNTLRYIDYTEFSTKIQMCRALGIRPVFAVRMLPKSWIHEVISVGGFALILKHQLYPWAHRELARRVKTELGLPVRRAEGAGGRNDGSISAVASGPVNLEVNSRRCYRKADSTGLRLRLHEYVVSGFWALCYWEDRRVRRSTLCLLLTWMEITCGL